MEFKVNIEYNQLLKLIQQLPEEKLEKLTKTLQTELRVKKTSSKKDIEQLILNAPTWSDEQLKDFQEVRDYVNSSRLA